ncbi:DUF2510 domain-containing protein [Demequina salsinemoris]|uniref:DUF2510 domain-containing protein n=1 Tax=Demequina salsinemoris TaxID=577470 RepID=UPI00078253E8|nr:DUF2510 domain-containing protein [Demequina salsinemoris]
MSLTHEELLEAFGRELVWHYCFDDPSGSPDTAGIWEQDGRWHVGVADSAGALIAEADFDIADDARERLLAEARRLTRARGPADRFAEEMAKEPGWRPDPELLDGDHLRWWDGGAWTEHRDSMVPAPAPALGVAEDAGSEPTFPPPPPGVEAGDRPEGIDEESARRASWVLFFIMAVGVVALTALAYYVLAPLLFWMLDTFVFPAIDWLFGD